MRSLRHREIPPNSSLAELVKGADFSFPATESKQISQGEALFPAHGQPELVSRPGIRLSISDQIVGSTAGEGLRYLDENPGVRSSDMFVKKARFPVAGVDRNTVYVWSFKGQLIRFLAGLLQARTDLRISRPVAPKAFDKRNPDAEIDFLIFLNLKPKPDLRPLDA